MNYQKIYDSLISQAKSVSRDKKQSYFESHHIIPKCLGGEDEVSNIVLLTAREHYVAHMLLWRIDRKNYKLFAPLLYFKRHKHVKNSRTFEAIRKIHQKFMIEDNPSCHLSEESKASKKLKLTNRVFTEEHRLKISKANSGKQPRLGATLNEESKNLISNSLKTYYENNEVSESTREKLKIAMTGKKFSQDDIEKMRLIALKRPKYVCTLCGKPNLDPGNFALHSKTKHKLTQEQIKEERSKQENNHGLLTKAFAE